VSFKSMYNVIRRLVLDGKATSLDIVNAHPTILKQSLETYAPEFLHPYLDMYVNTREVCLVKVMETHNVSRAQTKDLFIRMAYGGSYKVWAESIKIDVSEPGELILGFYSEMAEIQTDIAPCNFTDANYTRYVQVANKIKDKTGDACFRSALALFLQDVEREVMLLVMDYVTTKLGYTIEAIIHDEVLLKGDVQEILETQIPNICEHVTSQAPALSLRFECKNTRPTKEDIDWYNLHARFITHDESTDYAYVKTQFEETNFKVNDPVSYWELKSNGKLVSRQKKQFCERYATLSYIEIVDGKPEKFSFVNNWLKDHEQRVYEEVNFLPPPKIVPDGVYNLWNGFASEKIDTPPAEDISTVLNHIKHVICNHDEDAYDYIVKWIAQIIQQPGILSGTAIVVKGEQGSGKDTFMKIVQAVIGKEYVAETSNPEKDIFARFSNMRTGKLFVDIKEARLKDSLALHEAIKDAIDSELINFEKKGIDPCEIDNYARLLFTTNNAQPLALDNSDRRMVLLETNDEYCGNKEYFTKLYAALSEPSVKVALLNYFKRVDISHVNWIEDRPKTAFYQDIQGVSNHPFIGFVEEIMLDSEEDRFDASGVCRFTSGELMYDYRTYCEKYKIKEHCSTPAKFGLLVKAQVGKCDGIVHNRSKKGVFFDINRQVLFDWMKSKRYTEYEELSWKGKGSNIVRDDELDDLEVGVSCRGVEE
jgi:hypothetical protein